MCREHVSRALAPEDEVANYCPRPTGPVGPRSRRVNLLRSSIRRSSSSRWRPYLCVVLPKFKVLTKVYWAVLEPSELYGAAEHGTREILGRQILHVHTIDEPVARKGTQPRPAR